MFTFINESRKPANMINEKDWSRMKLLWDKRSNGGGIALKITDPSKAIARYIAGLFVTKKELPAEEKFNIPETFMRDADWLSRFAFFWPFAKKAICLGATYDDFKSMYDNSKTFMEEHEEKLSEEDLDEIEKQQSIIRSRNIVHSVLWFNNLASAFLFAWEESGQISDGKYENSLPYDHWCWLANVYDADAIFVHKSYKPYSLRKYVSHLRSAWQAAYRPKNYNINDKTMMDDCGDEMLCYGRFGRALPNCQASFAKYFNRKMDFRSICEYLGLEKQFDYVEDFLEDVENKRPYLKALEWLPIFSQLDYDAYYRTKYTVKDLKADLHSMDATVNNFDVIY